METDTIERLISDRSYPFQLDAAAKQLDLPWPTTSATPSQHVQPDRAIYIATTEATKKTTTTGRLDYYANYFIFVWTVLKWLLMIIMFVYKHLGCIEYELATRIIKSIC